MPKNSRWSLTTLGLLAFAFAAALGACTGGSGTPTIGPPLVITTPSPTPTLLISPSSITFPAGNRAPQQVNITAPNPSNVGIAVVKDSCTAPGIASQQPATPPPSPSPSPTPQTYTITPGAKNGTCAFTFQDVISTAEGVLSVTNDSGAAPRRP